MKLGLVGKATLLLGFLFGGLVFFMAKSSAYTSANELADHQDNLNPVYVDFTKTGWAYGLYLASYSVNKDHHYRVNYSPRAVSWTRDGIKLNMKDAVAATKWLWDSAEIHVPRKTGYGRYEVIMKPADTGGVISSFFTYTGPFYGDPHDEIDIEFLGKNRDEVEFNIFTNGEPAGSVPYKLGYNVSQAFHLYAFDWQPDAVRFYVDGEFIHSFTSKEFELPSHAGRMMINLWTGTLTDWHGEASPSARATAQYKCIAYRPSGDTTSPLCSD